MDVPTYPNHENREMLQMMTNLISQVVSRRCDPSRPETLEQKVQKMTGNTETGWKQIPGCLHFMESIGINPEDFELVAEKVIHPNIRGFNRFVVELENDPNCSAPDLNIEMIDTNLRTYIVSCVTILC